jgi:xylulokinase
MTLVLQIGWTEAATDVVVVDTAAHSKVGEGRATHPDVPDGLVDPEAWWFALVSATRLALDGLSALGLQPSELRGTLITAGDPQGGLVAVGADGGAVHPALLASHTSSGADADWLVGHLDGGADAWTAATGVLPTAGSTVSLLSWLHRCAPDAWGSASRFTLPVGWLLERLGGDRAVPSHAAVGTAVLDLHTGDRWRTELLAVVDGDRDWVAALPVVATTARTVGALSPAAATELGLPAGLPLHVGGPGIEPTDG